MSAPIPSFLGFAAFAPAYARLVRSVVRVRDASCAMLPALSSGGLALLFSLVVAAFASAQDQALDRPQIALSPGEYLWMPELAPHGPLLVLVSLPEQLVYVYRNGVRIGVSTVSTGKAGYETPTGVFTILEKRREHYSNLYDNAPMPFMQRLTWDGVALHAGRLPGYPASHGCVRLPRAFAEKLFAATRPGTTVVIADRSAPVAGAAPPGLFSPLDPQGAPAMPVVADVDAAWILQEDATGPVTVIASVSDRRVVVLREGVEVGRAPLRTGEGDAALAVRGTHLYLRLEGTGDGASLLAPDRPVQRWQSLPVAALGPGAGDVRAAVQAGVIGVAPDFARALYAVLTPGSTVIVTDEPLQPGANAQGERVLLETPAIEPRPEPLLPEQAPRP